MPLTNKLTVLVAEDDPPVLEMISSTFSAFGLTVLEATDGRIAWEVVQREKVDIVVTDVRMPNATGVDLLKWIRDRDINNPKVYFMTGFSDFSSEQIFEMGADGLFLKPFHTKTVLEALRKCLLSMEERWSAPPLTSTASLVERKFDSPPFEGNGTFQLGRGGFCLAIDNPEMVENQLISFKLRFGEQSLLDGMGNVQWIQPSRGKKEAGSPSHRIGVEFAYLEQSCRKAVIDWITAHKYRAYIPSN